MHNSSVDNMTRLKNAFDRIDETSIVLSQIQNRVDAVLTCADSYEFDASYYKSLLKDIAGRLGIAQDTIYGINK